ncbi:MAG TPA: hypothetical protein ENK77_02805 [Epsilonproteobacteria bacterium]|nr:hypothetical protein [Campylobacterota bacterium]
MRKDAHYIVPVLLVISALLLSSLIPGGPIENRDFSRIDPSILLSFNIFLTILGLGSFILAIYTLKMHRWAYLLAFVAGMSYFTVYAIDLYEIFPKSPTEMSATLLAVEMTGAIVALPLIYCSYTGLFEKEQTEDQIPVIKQNRWGIVTILVLGTGIILFSTYSAMNP